MFPSWWITRARQYGQLAQRFNKRYDEIVDQQRERARDQVRAAKVDEKVKAEWLEQVDQIWYYWYDRLAPAPPTKSIIKK